MSEEEKISKFSSGLNIIMRVDILWKNCLNNKRDGRYQRWNDELDSVWLELARDLNPKEYYDLDEEGNILYDNDKEIKTEGYRTQFDSFEKRLKEILPFIDSGNFGFNKPTPEQTKKRDKQYKLLMEKQLFLARLENKLGKGTSWDEEDDDF